MRLATGKPRLSAGKDAELTEPGCCKAQYCNANTHTHTVKGTTLVHTAVVGNRAVDDMGKRAEDRMRRISELEDKIVTREGRIPVANPAPERPIE